MSTPQETNQGATRLEWSADDDDDFFSEEKSDDGFDVDIDVNVDDEDLVGGSESKQAEDSNDPSPETQDLSEGVAMDATMDTDAADPTGDESESVAGPGASPGPSSPTRSVSSANPTSPGGRPPRPTVVSSSGPKLPHTPNTTVGVSSSLVSNAVDSGMGRVPATPLSLAESTLTSASKALVEVKDEDDEDFEEIVRQRNRVRKEREDYHIAHIKVEMGRLEDALAAETKRRVDATTALDELARTQVHEMESRVREQLREENERLQTRLTALEERVRTLEESWVVDANKQIELVNTKAADLNKSIAQIRDDQNMERKARLKREGILLRQVETHAKETEERWTCEHKDRVQRIKALEDQVIRNEARLALEQKRYEDRIETELATLQQELEIESAERQAQDEIIVAALNRYTKQLQHSLSILSSD